MVATAISLCALVRIASLSGLTANVTGSFVMGVLMLVTAVYFNMFGVIFTGLEHSAHTAATLLILAGLIATIEQDRVPWWLVPAIVAATLLRFEGIVASVVAIGVLAVLGQYRKAIAAVVVLGGCLAAYAAIMFALGLPLSAKLGDVQIRRRSVPHGAGCSWHYRLTSRSALLQTSRSGRPKRL